jgi:hypothetical protein
MIGRLSLLFIALVVATLSLSGCIVGDGIAHLVKLTEESQKKDAAAPAKDSPGDVPAARREEAPPPPPAAAPSRSAVSVETLAPPK